eukprot:1055085-Amphidinium_carterae.1
MTLRFLLKGMLATTSASPALVLAFGDGKFCPQIVRPQNQKNFEENVSYARTGRHVSKGCWSACLFCVWLCCRRLL